MKARPTILKNALAGISGPKKSIKTVSGGESESISKLSSDAQTALGFSRSSAYDAEILNSLKGGNLQDVRGFASTGADQAWTLTSASPANGLGTVGVDGKGAANALPDSARPDIFDDGGFGPGQRDFREIWGNNGISHGSSDGDYDAYGNFIANVVKPQIHEKPADAVLDDKSWKQASTNLGFLFQNGEQLNTALKHNLDKLEGKYQELGQDAWSLSFLTANGISKGAANGEVGDFLLSDKQYFDSIQKDQVGTSGNALEQLTHDMNVARMKDILSDGSEGMSFEQVSQVLADRAGIEGDKQFFAGSARGFIETAKNFEFLDSFDSQINDAIAQNPELANEKAKFNININFLPYSSADSGAFAAINRGHEFGQQSKLKDFGLSFDPEKPNQLNFMINNEAQLEALLTQIDDKFSGNSNVEIGKLQFDFHRHGGEDGSNLTGNAQQRDNGNNEGGSFVVNDENNFDGKTDGDIFETIGEIAGKHGADVNICGDSCHSGNFTDLIKDDVFTGMQKGQNEVGSDETLKLSVVDNGENPGYTPAQSLKSIQGYMTYKFDNDGAAGLEFVMSNSSLSTTRRDDMFVNKDTDSLDSARSDAAKQQYFDEASDNIEALAQRKEAGNKDENAVVNNDADKQEPETQNA